VSLAKYCWLLIAVAPLAASAGPLHPVTGAPGPDSVRHALASPGPT